MDDTNTSGRERFVPLVVAISTGTILGGIISAYMIFLRAPAVIAVRPELEHAGFWTALFSGRFESWLWWHYPAPVTILTVLILTVGVMWVVSWW